MSRAFSPVLPFARLDRFFRANYRAHLLRGFVPAGSAVPGDPVAIVLAFDYDPNGAGWIIATPVFEILVHTGPGKSPLRKRYAKLPDDIRPIIGDAIMLAISDGTNLQTLIGACQARYTGGEDPAPFEIFLTPNAALLIHDDPAAMIYDGRYLGQPRIQEHVDEAMVMLAPEPASAHDAIRQKQVLRQDAEMFRHLAPVPDQDGTMLLAALPPALAR